jgi:hypothetical protein
MFLGGLFQTTHFNPLFLMSRLGYTDPLLPAALFLEFFFISPNSKTAPFQGQDHIVSWRSFSRPHIPILFSYWSYDSLHQLLPVHNWPIGTEFYPLFPIYTGLPRASSACHLLARFFTELFYDPEDGGDTFLRNVGYHSTHYTASCPRRRYSSKSL